MEAVNLMKRSFLLMITIISILSILLFLLWCLSLGIDRQSKSYQDQRQAFVEAAVVRAAV